MSAEVAVDSSVNNDKDMKNTESCENAEKENKEKVEFKVVFNKKKFDISFGLDDTIGALKVHLQDIIDVPNTMQKVMIKGLAKDEMSLRQVSDALLFNCFLVAQYSLLIGFHILILISDWLTGWCEQGVQGDGGGQHHDRRAGGQQETHCSTVEGKYSLLIG